VKAPLLAIVPITEVKKHMVVLIHAIDDIVVPIVEVTQWCSLLMLPTDLGESEAGQIRKVN